MSQHGFRRTHKNKNGQALVETALSIFILFLLVFGITEFGRAMYTKNTLNNAARAGARRAVVTQGITIDTQSDLTKSLDCSKNPNDCVYQAVRDSLYNGIDKSQVSVSIASKDSSNINDSPAKTGDTISVTVTYGTAGNAKTGFQSVVPNLINMIPNVLTGQAAMRFE